MTKLHGELIFSLWKVSLKFYIAEILHKIGRRFMRKSNKFMTYAIQKC